MKNVFILAYARQNLGDDIFIKLLLERNKEINFFIKVPDYSFIKWLDINYDNLNVLIGNDTDDELEKLNVKDYDAYVYIGGSIFMEGGHVYNLSETFYKFMCKCKENNIPFYYISCNYGPYQTKEYFELSKRNFKKCTDICFRDTYSYNLFKDISTVRYAPDYIFTLKPDINETISNSIGISVISRDNEFNKKYFKFLCDNIENFIKEGKQVYLFSFCKHEGDEIAIDYILNKFKNNNNIIDIRYNGDINEFLKIYFKMECMLTMRFHAMILSIIARQKIVVASYSKKIDNVIKDLNLDLKLLNLDSLNTKILLEEFKRVPDNKINQISHQAYEQEKMFIKGK